MLFHSYLFRCTGRHFLATFFFSGRLIGYRILLFDTSLSQFILPSTHALSPLPRLLGLHLLLIISTFKYSMVLDLLCDVLEDVCFPLQFIDTLGCCPGPPSVFLVMLVG